MNETSIAKSKTKTKPAKAKALTPAFKLTHYLAPAKGERVDLALAKNGGAVGALVLKVTPQRSDEVLCVWSEGATFMPTTGTYWVLWFKGPAFQKPSVPQIEKMLDDAGIAGSPPGTINLHPPPTPDQ